MKEVDVDLRRFFDALADATRLRIVGLLALEPRTLSELAALLDTRPAAVVRHLARLRRLGLVVGEREGRYLRYRLEAALLLAWSRQLATARNRQPAAATGSGEDWERRVIADFQADGRQAPLPARRGKRMVVLRWLAGHFRPGDRYDEAQVNEIIRRYHEDPALLRRLMVDEELMQRASGLYWRAGTRPMTREGSPTG